MSNPEEVRLQEDIQRTKNWKRWGPYLSERQWGTVREDYSPDGSCWSYLSHDHSRSRAYRWGEDGLLGITDRECRMCFALALWNGRDAILKERLFGLTGPEGNHGEDVKECYYYLDSSPTHSYMKALYKYPQDPFPYDMLLSESKRRSKNDLEFELRDLGIFDQNRYFDVFAEYAKNSPNDILIRITVVNRGPTISRIHVLPTLWFRNNWSWGRSGEGYVDTRPVISHSQSNSFQTQHQSLEKFYLCFEDHRLPNKPETLFTENETNIHRLFGGGLPASFVKDAFHEYVVKSRKDTVNPAKTGSKAAFHTLHDIDSGDTLSIKLRLFSESEAPADAFSAEFDQIIEQRRSESDQFYAQRVPKGASADEVLIARQAYAGLLWSKQFYYYSVKEWHEGDPSQPAPAPGRKAIRNADWQHLYNRDVISMPDKWEYPWYAAWDLAFHMIPFSKIDPDFAKQQLLLLLREWYMHPNGQIPAYEFAFSDVNPPVHAWACWRVYKVTASKGNRDRVFLARAFHKLLLNFTWWINRKDIGGHNLFSGGFLGLDNIGVFDRGQPVPGGGVLEQADATAWMAFFCGTMLSMALELASEDPSYEDVASKFFEHFVAITDAINTFGGSGLWDDLDGFYYDQLRIADKTNPLRIRSLVGVIPLLAVEVLEQEVIDRLPGFKKRLLWFLEHRTELAKHISYMENNEQTADSRRLLAVPSRQRLERVLRYVLDENEFLSPFGVRSLSKIHKRFPYEFKVDAQVYKVEYTPAESNTSIFGGNSNWRGPVWFPINYLLIEALERYHHFYGETLTLDCPTGSGNQMNLRQIAKEMSVRMSRIFAADQEGRRPCHGDELRYATDPAWKDLVLFYEYFDGDTARGCGASHQTGWSALVTRCIERKY
ncbi:MAG: glucosidase [Proteobacteria bacterium]|nr:MAG: glucosidase [Pseudomonadota bacterium]